MCWSLILWPYLKEEKNVQNNDINGTNIIPVTVKAKKKEFVSSYNVLQILKCGRYVGIIFLFFQVAVFFYLPCVWNERPEA
jgi:hypothetical protein